MHSLGREPQETSAKRTESPGGATEKTSFFGSVTTAAGGFEDDPVAGGYFAPVNAIELAPATVGVDDHLATDRTIIAARHTVRSAHPMLTEDRKLERRQELDLTHEAVPPAPPSATP